MELNFRLLRADEIDARVSQITANSVMLLLYKDARCDMNILDETVGPMNWMRAHSRDNANCTVSIWDNDKKMWISKEDTGTESNTEKEKGLASDSFKRACTNWGIGRELYTSPSLFFPRAKTNAQKGTQGRDVCYDKFIVEEIQYDGRNVAYVRILDANTQQTYEAGFLVKKSQAKKAPSNVDEPVNDEKAVNHAKKVEPNRNTNVYTKAAEKAKKTPQETLADKCIEDGINTEWMAKCYKKNRIGDLTDVEANNAIDHWTQVKRKYVGQ